MKPKIEVMIGVQSCILVGHFFVKRKKMIKRLKTYLPKWYVELWHRHDKRNPDNDQYTYRKGIQVADPEIEDIIRTERKK